MTAKQHGGKREGAGRPKGSLNRRSLAVIEEVAERYPHWSPLLHLASVANDESRHLHRAHALLTRRVAAHREGKHFRLTVEFP